MLQPLCRFTVVAVVVLATLAVPLFADTAQFRGPSRGEIGALPEGEFGLGLAWSRSLGSGYSNVWIEGTAGGDHVCRRAEGAATGSRPLTWHRERRSRRYELGSTYEGHDGSDDGPIGNPTVAGDIVYALGPSGQFVAVDLDSGAEGGAVSSTRKAPPSPRTAMPPRPWFLATR